MSSGVKSKVRDFFNKFFWRQHPDAALRYTPIVSELKKARLDKAKILEIGPGSLGIIPYLKREIDGIDVDFSGPQTKLLHKIKGTATNLPFKKNSYDATISVDILEHLAKEQRVEAISQQIKVTKKLALIIVPIGAMSQNQDKELNERFQKVFHTKNQFLTEHVTNGLPTTDEILVEIDKSLRNLKKEAKVRSYPNLNLKVRKILMMTWISNNKLIYYMYLKGFLLLLPILRLANFSQCYRRVFVIEFAS